MVAGTAVFIRALETLNLPGIHYSAAGVRDGIIADLAARGVGRERSRLPRPQVRVVESMCRKYNVEMRNAKQVAGFAAQLFESLLPVHSLQPETGQADRGCGATPQHGTLHQRNRPPQAFGLHCEQF